MNFDKPTSEHSKLIDLIKHTERNNSLELESIITFGMGQSLSYSNFIDVISRLKNQNIIKTPRIKEFLKINFPSDTKYKYITAHILGNASIKTYCSKESIQSIGRNVHFTRRDVYRVNDKSPEFNMINYPIKFDLKKETLVDRDENAIQTLINEWKKIQKIFCQQKVFSFVTSDNRFQIDVSVMRNSSSVNTEMTISDVMKERLDEQLIPPYSHRHMPYIWWNKIKKNKNYKVSVRQKKTFNSIEDSKVFTNEPTYHISIKYIGNKIESPKKLTTVQKEKNYIKILEDNVKYLGILLQSIYQSSYIIGFTEMEQVSRKYNELIKKLEKRLGLSYKDSRNSRGINFVGMTPSILERKHLQRFTNKGYELLNIPNIRKNYLVTEQINGERNLLFINENGKVYLINRDGVIRYTGASIPEYKMSLFDGEMVRKDTNNRFTRNYYIFDVLFLRNNDVSHLNMGYKGEINSRSKFMKIFNNHLKTTDSIIYEHSDKHPLKFFNKVYHPGNLLGNYSDSDVFENDSQIFEACRHILDKTNIKYGGKLKDGHLFSYPTDGLVFVPRNLGIGMVTTEDNLFCKSKKEWSHLFKWKPKEFNSITFMVNFKTNSKGEHILFYRGDRAYKQVSLKVRYDPYRDNQCQNAFRSLNENLPIMGQPHLLDFKPVNPFSGKIDNNMSLIEDLHIAHLLMAPDGNIITNNGQIVVNNSIIDCTYNPNEEKYFRWSVKTLSSKLQCDSFYRANQIWKQINDSISSKELMTGINPSITNQEQFEELDLNNQDELAGLVQESKNSTNFNNIFPYYRVISNSSKFNMKSFNNYLSFIKENLLELTLDNNPKAKILDLGCGKMNDFFKYARRDVKMVLSVDCNQNNLFNNDDSGPIRVIKIKNNSSKVKKLANNSLVIYGDITKNLANGDSGLDELSKHYLNILYGKTNLDDYSKLSRMFGLARDKFDIIISHMAIDSIFSSKDSVEGFVVNLYENLKENGVFIGTCLDGKRVLNALKKGETTSSKSGKRKYIQANTFIPASESAEKSKKSSKSSKSSKSNKTSKLDIPNKSGLIWKIIQNYDTVKSISDDETSLGMEIGFQTELLAGEVKQYLVNFEYFTKLLVQYDIQLVDSKYFDEELGSYLNSFKAHNSESYEDINTDNFKQFVSFHRWFMFIKKADISDNPTLIGELGYDENNDANNNSDQESNSIIFNDEDFE